MLVLIVLLACVVLSGQQFLPDYGQRGLFWLPYLLPSPRINHYQPVYYEYPEDDEFYDSQTFAKPLEQSQELFGGVESRSNHKDNEEMDGILGDDYSNIRMRMNNPGARLFLLGGDSTFDNPFWRTATFTMTSTMNITSIQPCLPVAQFSAGSSTIVCRRKKRNIHQDSLGISDDDQFAIEPSKPLPLMTTRLATIDQLEDNHSVVNRDMITSSKDDIVNDEVRDRLQHAYKEKRFLLQNVASTTVYSYVFNSVVVTKTVNLVAGIPRLVCRPVGFVLC